MRPSKQDAKGCLGRQQLACCELERARCKGFDFARLAAEPVETWLPSLAARTVAALVLRGALQQVSCVCHPAGAGSASISSNDIQAVIRLVGYGLNPFTTSQQGTLQVTLYDVLPHISSQVRCLSLHMSHLFCNPCKKCRSPRLRSVHVRTKSCCSD